MHKMPFCPARSNATNLLNIEPILSSPDEIELKSYLAFSPEGPKVFFFLSSETGVKSLC